jgi:hypothetical protein
MTKRKHISKRKKKVGRIGIISVLPKKDRHHHSFPKGKGMDVTEEFSLVME